MTTPRYRSSSVRAVLEPLTRDRAAAAAAHDALWATLWNRGYEDVAEPVWLPDAAYAGLVAFARSFPEGGTLAGLDVGAALVVFRGLGELLPIGSRARVVPAERDHWRWGEGSQTVGLGIELHFDAGPATADQGWIEPLRTGLARLRAGLDGRRAQLEARRAELGALSEPTAPEEIWRRELAGISHAAMLETEFTPDELAAMARARAKGVRHAGEERRIAGLRRQRFEERNAAAVAAFRETRWPALRDAAAAETARYAAYRAEVVRLEEALQGLRGLHERAGAAAGMLAAIERAEFSVAASGFDPARLGEAGYAQELVRTVELLHAAIPPRPRAAGFSAYRAPTAGPAVIPPRV